MPGHQRGDVLQLGLGGCIVFLNSAGLLRPSDNCRGSEIDRCGKKKPVVVGVKNGCCFLIPSRPFYVRRTVASTAKPPRRGASNDRAGDCLRVICLGRTKEMLTGI